jgi:hypothetical protein
MGTLDNNPLKLKEKSHSIEKREYPLTKELGLGLK